MYLTLTSQLSSVTGINKMTSVLTTCTKKEQQAVIRFLRDEGGGSVEIHCRLSAWYGDSVLLQ
jgi:hypothetical protein